MQRLKFLFLLGLMVFGMSVDVSYAAKVVEPTPALLKEWQQRGGFSHDLKRDMWSADVTFLRNIFGENMGKNDVPYKYDEDVEKLVKKFQKSKRLKQSGEFDVKTRTALNNLFMETLCPLTGSRQNLSDQQITKNTRIPADYVPTKLEVLSGVKTAVPICVEKDTADALKDMFVAAESDGVKLMVSSGYRDPRMQQYVYDYWVSVEGKDARHRVAKPGYSEHQLGTAVDLTDVSIQYSGVDEDFGKSAGGKWLKRNAHKYGFSMSYPKGKEKVTGFAYEPWHWRYVGKDVATTLREKKISFAEYNSKKVSKQKLVSKSRKENLE